MAFHMGDSYDVLPRTVAGFLKLVELCKGLVVLSCLASLVEVYEIHDPLADG
jgi:predicted nuclease with RNAse H fold